MLNPHPQSNGIVKRGVNDCSEVLQELCQKLVRLRVFPYYLHHTDSVKGNRHFRISYSEGREIYSELSKRSEWFGPTSLCY